jgi:hypothetical protein
VNRANSQKFINISEENLASFFKAKKLDKQAAAQAKSLICLITCLTLNMEAVRSSETSTRLHGVTAQKTILFIMPAVRISNVTIQNNRYDN